MPLCPAFARIWKARHQLEGRNVGREATPFILAHFDYVDEQDFQQGKIQLEKHV